MILDRPNIFENKNKKVKLVAESFEEPNVGRTFWKYKFYVEGDLVINSFLKYENEGLFDNLTSFIFESNDGCYVYIPKRKPVIYNVSKDKFKEFKIPLKEGNLDFVKNFFYENKLIIIYRNGVVVIDLNFNTIRSLEYAVDSVFIEDLKMTNKGEMEVDYRDLKRLEFAKKIIKL
ncbi:hypothetical protein [Tenacibaculum halocynthiae]|uniref:hypothetical protein n=1 Tax=Tenacibaculum halocynthiae TaxID=1254437 RepID=UPI003D65A507